MLFSVSDIYKTARSIRETWNHEQNKLFMQGFTDDLHRNVFCSSCFIDDVMWLDVCDLCSSNIMVKYLFVDFDRSFLYLS